MAQPFNEHVVGLIPAAGRATRLAPLPFSKELYPVGFRSVDKKGGLRPKVACHFLLERMRSAGIAKAYLILGQHKWDIPAYFGDGDLVNMHLAYLVPGSPLGTPYSLDQAFPFVRETTVAFGFPDILFQSEDVFDQLLACQAASRADITLGLFPAVEPEQVEMVATDREGRVKEIIAKPEKTDLVHTWCTAVWTPVFTLFLHEHLAKRSPVKPCEAEISVGDVIKAAIKCGLRAESVVVSNQACLDIGTPEGLAKAAAMFGDYAPGNSGAGS